MSYALKVINSRHNKNEATISEPYAPTALELRHDSLVQVVRTTRKSLRREVVRLRKAALTVLALSVISMALWVYFATYARDLLDLVPMIILGLIGVGCVVGTMAVAGIMTATSYALEEASKKLSKEV